MIGYKGFDQNFCCRDFQYEIGKTYRCDSKIKICENGFHFCDTPLAVFEFYPPTSRFALVEATGQILRGDDNDHKFCTNEIHIIKELSLSELIDSANEKITNTGNCSAAIVTGQNSIAVATGYRSKAKGAINCWLVLCEYQNSELVDVRAFKVDGKVILPDVFYTLKDGKAVPADD